MIKQNNSNLKALSKASEMLDNLRRLCAQALSRMSKMTKMKFIKELLNQSLATCSKTGVQNMVLS